MAGGVAYLCGLLAFLGLCAFFALQPGDELCGNWADSDCGDMPRLPDDLKIPVHARSNATGGQ
jgi:hypothetical protein